MYKDHKLSRKWLSNQSTIISDYTHHWKLLQFLLALTSCISIRQSGTPWNQVDCYA